MPCPPRQRDRRRGRQPSPRRRLALSARTPRELLIPVMTPLLFAIVIAPALADTFGAAPGGIDYMTYVAVSTIGLLVPLSCMTVRASASSSTDSAAPDATCSPPRSPGR